MNRSLGGFRRLYRWFNLTLVHQGVWPLLIVLANAPDVNVGATPTRWYPIRIAAPLLATLLAWVYLAQRPAEVARGDARTPRSPHTERWAPARRQVQGALIALAAMLAVARLIDGPTEPALKLLLFGAADVAAYQAIHFGVVARSFPSMSEGQAAAVGLFAASWALRSTFLAELSDRPGGEVFLAAVSGFIVGLAIGALSRALRRWPGGWWSAGLAHWILLYGVAVFIV